MDERRSFRQLEWLSFSLLALIGMTVTLLSFDLLPLYLFKITLAIFLAIACILFLFLRATITGTITKGKIRFKNAEDKFARIYQSDIIGILITTLDGDIVEANQAFLDIIGYTREDLLKGNLQWDKITPPEFMDISREAVEQLKTAGTSFPFEKQYTKKDGSAVWVMVGSSRLTENDVGDAITYVIDISNKKNAEKRTQELLDIIKHQQEEFRSVFMNAPAFITIRRGPELRYEFVNKAVMDFSKRSDHIGQTSEEMYPDSATSDDVMIAREVYNTGKAKKGNRHKLRVKTIEGEKEIYLDYYITPVFNHLGSIDGVASFGFEVTDLVLANQEMQISKNRFSRMADSLPHKIWMGKANGQISYLNKAWKEYAYTKDPDSLKWENIIDQNHYPEIYEKWRKLIELGAEYEMEIPLKRADGVSRWHNARAVPLKDHSGQLVMWIGTSTDIHDQKEQVQALKASEDHFRMLADETPFMVWKTDAEGNCIYVNKKWTEFTGLSFEDSMGAGFANAIKPDDDLESRKETWTDSVARKLPYERKFQLKKADGSYRWMIAKANPYHVDSLFAGYIGSIVDITDQEMATQALKDLSEKKDEFLSIASHELKTPVTSIKAFIQLIEKSIDPGHHAAAFVTKASSHVTRLERLISDLLDVSKINSGKILLNKTEFNFHEMLEESVKSIQHTVKHQIIIEHQAKVSFTGDRFRIEQVVYNFLTNAVKYSPQADKIIVKSDIIGNEIVVSIQDFGIGIEKENLPMIFDRYYRVDNTYMRYQGLGLGLFISADIIRRHHGRFWIESEPGKGSTFYFSLPLSGSPPNKKPEKDDQYTENAPDSTLV